jgi:hypothetical protein
VAEGHEAETKIAKIAKIEKIEKTEKIEKIEAALEVWWSPTYERCTKRSRLG